MVEPPIVQRLFHALHAMTMRGVACRPLECLEREHRLLCD